MALTAWLQEPSWLQAEQIGVGMPIEFSDEMKADILKRLQSYMFDEFDQDIGDLRALKILDFMNGLIGANAYNHGIADAQAWLGQRVADLTGDLHQEVDWRV